MIIQKIKTEMKLLVLVRRQEKCTGCIPPLLLAPLLPTHINRYIYDECRRSR